MLGDEAVDNGLQFGGSAEDAMRQPSPRELGEEALDGAQPGARSWREVKGPGLMACEVRRAREQQSS